MVLDTAILVSALRSAAGASNLVLREVAARRLLPVVTTALFLEYEDVLKRAEQRLAHGLGLDQVDRFLAAFASASIAVEVQFRWRPQLADPADEMVLEAAAHGQVSALVTHNVRDFMPAAGKFGVRVLRPGRLIAELSDE